MQENKKDLKGQQNLGTERQEQGQQSEYQKGIKNPQRENVSDDEDLDDEQTQRGSQSEERSGNQQLGKDKSDRRL